MLVMVSVLSPAILTTMKALAAQHGNKHGQWFEDLSAQLIKQAKSSDASVFPMGDEVAGIDAGLNVIQGLLDVVRRDLT
ncbi:hypothetical protein C0214_01115 [Methylobacterium sp. DM1]|nr:hypothetical protein C0214_01115 [Methylobacterium sp. DM1]